MPKLIQKNLEATKIYSLYESTKRRLIDEFQRIRTKYQLKNLVLVVDLPSAKILSGLFTITELVEYSVVFIERLQVIRKPLDHHAIYFITPNQQSVASMLKDFEQQATPQYRKVHVLFTGSLQEGLIREISKSKHFLKRLARHSFKEFYCELEIISDNCAHMNIPYLQHAFSAQNSREKELRVQIAKRMVHLVAAYPNLNTVRFLYDKDTPNKVAERVVQRCAKEVNNYLMKLLESKSQAIDPNAFDLTVFVVDRSIDVITPTIHGYAYESLLYDLLNEGGKQSQQYAKLPRQIFNEFRYRHISHALQELPERLNEVLQKINKGSKLDPMQVKSMVDQKQKLNIHVQLLHRLFQRYKQKNLNQIGELELCLATGVTEDGQQTSSSELIGKVLSQIKNNKVLTIKELVRLAMLVLICVKVSKEDYQTLLSLFPEEYKAVLTNLVVLGISYDKKISKSTKNIEKSAMDRARHLLTQKSIPSQRFQSALQITLPRLISLLRKDKSQERRKIGEVVVSVSSQSGLQPRFDQQRLICFMCGGLSPSQICNIRRDHSLDAVVLAADNILTPQDFLDSLGKIDILRK